jgi:hypothetical protein
MSITISTDNTSTKRIVYFVVNIPLFIINNLHRNKLIAVLVIGRRDYNNQLLNTLCDLGEEIYINCSDNQQIYTVSILGCGELLQQLYNTVEVGNSNTITHQLGIVKQVCVDLQVRTASSIYQFIHLVNTTELGRSSVYSQIATEHNNIWSKYCRTIGRLF